MKPIDCEYCKETGGELLWQDERCRIVRIDDADYPGLCRVIWFSHVREMSDLSDIDRRHLMEIVFAVERALRETLSPFKINLASLGNVTPHLHWHVIPRFRNDRHFPKPIWTTPERDSLARELSRHWQSELTAAVLRLSDR